MANATRVSLLTTALRSDRFQQGTGHLTKYPSTHDEVNCCLGVACIIAMENGLELDYVDMPNGMRYYLGDEGHTCGRKHDEWDGLCGCYDNDTVLPHKVVEWYGFPDEDPDMKVVVTTPTGNTREEQWGAAALNDDMGLDFAQIADAFDANFVHLAEPEDPSGRLEP